jgi:hypothetical protein
MRNSNKTKDSLSMKGFRLNLPNMISTFREVLSLPTLRKRRPKERRKRLSY